MTAAAVPRPTEFFGSIICRTSLEAESAVLLVTPNSVRWVGRRGMSGERRLVAQYVSTYDVSITHLRVSFLKLKVSYISLAKVTGRVTLYAYGPADVFSVLNSFVCKQDTHFQQFNSCSLKLFKISNFQLCIHLVILYVVQTLISIRSKEKSKVINVGVCVVFTTLTRNIVTVIIKLFNTKIPYILGQSGTLLELQSSFGEKLLGI